MWTRKFVHSRCRRRHRRLHFGPSSMPWKRIKLDSFSKIDDDEKRVRFLLRYFRLFSLCFFFLLFIFVVSVATFACRVRCAYCWHLFGFDVGLLSVVDCVVRTNCLDWNMCYYREHLFVLGSTWCLVSTLPQYSPVTTVANPPTNTVEGDEKQWNRWITQWNICNFFFLCPIRLPWIRQHRTLQSDTWMAAVEGTSVQVHATINSLDRRENEYNFLNKMKSKY